MNAVESTLRRVAKDLTGLRQRWALVGGFAVSARSEPRFTRDVDIVVAVANDDAAESLVRQLLTQQYHLLASVEQDAARRLAAVRLGATADTAANVVVDLLFASCGIEPEIAEAAEEIEILPDLVAPVATTAHLIAMKLLARDDDRRPQDRSDLRALVDAASPQDIQDARKAIELITLRGFHRDRDLAAEWTRLAAQQLGVLRRAGVVAARRDGNAMIYSIAAPDIAELLAVARKVLARVLSDRVAVLEDLRAGGSAT